MPYPAIMQGMAWWHRGGYSTAAPTYVGHGSFGVRAWWCQWRDKSGRSWFFGFWERERREKNRGKNASSSPVLCASRGRSRLMVPFKTAPFALSLSFFSSEMHETAPFWPKRVISFKRKLAPKWVNLRVFSLWSLVLDFFNRVPNWPPDFNMYAIKPLIWPNQLLKIIIWPQNFNFFQLKPKLT